MGYVRLLEIVEQRRAAEIDERPQVLQRAPFALDRAATTAASRDRPGRSVVPSSRTSPGPMPAARSAAAVPSDGSDALLRADERRHVTHRTVGVEDEQVVAETGRGLRQRGKRRQITPSRSMMPRDVEPVAFIRQDGVWRLRFV